MKTLTFSRLGLAGVLVLGLAVVWIGAAPSVTSAESIIGGFGPTSPGGCCTVGDDGLGACEDANTSPTSSDSLFCDDDGDAIYCNSDEDGDDTCQTIANIPCHKTSEPLSPCNSTHDMPCGG